jgi:hypothetical protein
MNGYQINTSMFTSINGSLRPDGTFTIDGVPPGEYQLRAQNMAAPSDGLREMATTMITVAGQDLADVRLVADAPTTATGRIILDPAVAASVVPSAFRVTVMPMPTGVMFVRSVLFIPLRSPTTGRSRQRRRQEQDVGTTPLERESGRVDGVDVTDTGSTSSRTGCHRHRDRGDQSSGDGVGHGDGQPR